MPPPSTRFRELIKTCSLACSLGSACKFYWKKHIFFQYILLELGVSIVTLSTLFGRFVLSFVKIHVDSNRKNIIRRVAKQSKSSFHIRSIIVQVNETKVMNDCLFDKAMIFICTIFRFANGTLITQTALKCCVCVCLCVINGIQLNYFISWLCVSVPFNGESHNLKERLIQQI